MTTKYNLIWNKDCANQIQKPNPSVADLKELVDMAEKEGGFVTIWTTYCGTAYPIPLKGYKLANARSSDSENIVKQLNDYFGQDVISI